MLGSCTVSAASKLAGAGGECSPPLAQHHQMVATASRETDNWAHFVRVRAILCMIFRLLRGVGILVTDRHSLLGYN